MVIECKSLYGVLDNFGHLGIDERVLDQFLGRDVQAENWWDTEGTDCVENAKALD